jgi:hypothetical protein
MVQQRHHGIHIQLLFQRIGQALKLAFTVGAIIDVLGMFKP